VRIKSNVSIGTKICNEKTFDIVKSLIYSPLQKKSNIFVPKTGTDAKI
jgi:hypothetical protein